MFRPVLLPDPIAGSLWLHSMPGYHEPLEQTWQHIHIHDIQTIVCLTDDREIRARSPSYAQAIQEGTVPCAIKRLPIANYGVPCDQDAFCALASEIATQLIAGDRILIHCAFGIGRTGTFATSVLVALNVPLMEAQRAVWMAGSRPETPSQQEVISRCGARIKT